MCVSGNKEDQIQANSMFHERDCRIATPKESMERNNKDKERSQYY